MLPSFAASFLSPSPRHIFPYLSSSHLSSRLFHHTSTVQLSHSSCYESPKPLKGVDIIYFLDSHSPKTSLFNTIIQCLFRLVLLVLAYLSASFSPSPTPLPLSRPHFTRDTRIIEPLAICCFCNILLCTTQLPPAHVPLSSQYHMAVVALQLTSYLENSVYN